MFDKFRNVRTLLTNIAFVTLFRATFISRTFQFELSLNSYNHLKLFHRNY